MRHAVVLSVDAITDIDHAFEYYNSRSEGLGFEFIGTFNTYLSRISLLPTSSAIYYDNVRVKSINTFPYNIHFTIQENGVVVILRVFNTYQQPFTGKL